MSTVRHGKKNHKSVVLLDGELQLLKELLWYLNDVLYVDVAVPHFDDSMYIEIDREKVKAFYGILRAVNKAIRAHGNRVA